MRKRRRPKKQRSQRKPRAKKGGFNLKRALLLLFVFLLGIYVAYSLIIFLGIGTRDPLTENISTHRFLSRLGDDLEITMFVFERDTGDNRRISDVYVLLNNGRKGNSMVLYLPGDMHFKGLEGEFGSPIPISSLRYAGDFLQEGRGVEYTLWQLNEILGFKVDNYIWISSEASDVLYSVFGDFEETKEKYKEGYVVDQGFSLSSSFLKLHSLSSRYSLLKATLSSSKLSQLNGDIYSNMSFLNTMATLGKYERVIENSKTFVIDFGSPKFSTEELSGQGGIVRNINVSEYDKIIRRNYIDIIDRNLERERVRVEIYNGSDIAGRAGLYARKVLNNGCDVVRFGNAPDIIEQTQVYVSDQGEFSNSLDVVSEVLFGRFELLEQRPTFMTTGDIVILLGQDIIQLEIF